MKSISVIIPVYNTGNLMHRCFESLASQTLGIDNLDVIVVDDGSNDNGFSLSIINEYVSKYPNSFRVISKSNGGQGSARNMAFPLAKGEFVTCLDSDDSFAPDWCEKMYNKAKENDADFVGCGYRAVRYDQTEGSRMTIVGRAVPKDKEIVVRELDMRPICSNNREMFIDANVSMFTTLFKREILEKSGARYPEGYIYEDTAFFIELLPWIEKPVYIEEALSCRTLHVGSTMTNAKPEKVANIFPVFEALIDFYKGKNLFENYKNELEYFIGKVLLCSSLNRVGFVKKYSERRKLVNRTQAFLNNYFPEFRKNPYIKGGVKGLYLKNYNKLLMNLMVEALRIRFRLKHDYNT